MVSELVAEEKLATLHHAAEGTVTEGSASQRLGAGRQNLCEDEKHDIRAVQGCRSWKVPRKGRMIDEK